MIRKLWDSRKERREDDTKLTKVLDEHLEESRRTREDLAVCAREAGDTIRKGDSYPKLRAVLSSPETEVPTEEEMEAAIAARRAELEELEAAGE